jgi:hypothetical protein
MIRHLQTQAALQQFTLETYNTAMTIASDTKQQGDEVWIRDVAPVSNPHRAATYLLPATEKKVTIAESMASEHHSYPAPQTPKKALEAYNSWTDFLTVFLARARLQLTCWEDWVENPSLDLSQRSTALDQAEDRSMTLAITYLNDLIQHAGISRDAWLSLNCAAFNDVRNRVDLPPLTETDFRARFLQGLAGGRPRFFL